MKQLKKGDMPYVIKMHSTTIVINIPPFDPPLIPKIYHEHNINIFLNRFCELWSFATHFVVALGIKSEFNYY
jgi:hypothetical protein